MNEVPMDRLGPYIVDGIVGKGAMGLVFSVHHETSDEKAAIKVLAPAIAADEKFQERFAAEIESLKTLNHPNIVKLLGYGEHDGQLYYAMELVEGTNLEQELASGRRFNWRDVTQIGIDVARALKHAHDHGVIHRDLKPANLLMDGDEQIKLTDFGIAKLFGSSDVTISGNVIGTVDYMAPEQAAGEATSPRSDLYSLGCVMYALLAGKPPFQGKSIPEVLHKVRYERHAPVIKHASEVPRDLSQIIDELLAKDPQDRIRTALSLSHRLRSIQQALSISTTDKSDFSSDEETDEVRRDSATNLIVNPPPDIAERPTVFVDEARKATDGASPTEIRRVKKAKLDHFTRIEQESKRRTEMGRVSEFSSALPLFLLLLVVLGGLLGGIWYSTQPPMSADELHGRIIDASDKLESKALARDVERFLTDYSDDIRVDRIQEIQEEIAIKELERSFEVRARGRPETGSLSPIEMHCYDAFRAYRNGDLEEAIAILDGIQRMFGTDSDRNDIRIQRSIGLVSRLKPEWQEELSRQILGLRASVELHRDAARELMKTDPARAREIWSGIVSLYNRPWAVDIYEEAQQAIQELDARPQEQTADHSSADAVSSETDSNELTSNELTSAEGVSESSDESSVAIPRQATADETQPSAEASSASEDVPSASEDETENS